MEQKFSSLLHVIATALVLALPGITLLGLLQTLEMQRAWSGQVPLAIELATGATGQSADSIKQALLRHSGLDASSYEFVSKEEAYNSMQDDPLLGLRDSTVQNPFRDLILIKSNGTKDPSALEAELKELLKPFPSVMRTDAGEGLSDEFARGLNKVKVILIALTIFLTGLAYFIIHYLLRYFLEKRSVIIRSMYLMGASAEAIYLPYRSLCLKLGLACGLMSIAWVGLSVTLLISIIPDSYKLVSLNNFLIIVTVLAILGPILHLIRLRHTLQSFSQQTF